MTVQLLVTLGFILFHRTSSSSNKILFPVDKCAMMTPSGEEKILNYNTGKKNKSMCTVENNNL